MSSSWRHSTWGEEVTLEYGKAIRGYRESDGEFRVFGSNGPIGWTSEPLVSGPGVILGRKGAYRGVEYSPDAFSVIDTAYYVVPKTELDLRWLFYAIQYYKLGEIDDGSPIPSTTRAAVYIRDLSIPPQDTQVCIAKILGDIDDKIELNRQTNQTLEDIAQAIFKSWFVDFDPTRAKIAAKENGQDPELAAMAAIAGKEVDELKALSADQIEKLKSTSALFPDNFEDTDIGAIPEGWAIESFSKIAKLDTTSVKPNKEPEKLWEHYSIPAFDVDESPAYELGEEIKSNKYKVDPSAILSSKLNPHFPRTWWPDIEDENLAVCSTEFMQFIPSSEDYRAFMLGLILSAPFQEGIMQRVTGSTGSRQRAQPKQVAAMNVVLPTENLIEVYSSRLESFSIMKAKNIKQNIRLAELRDALLPKLLSGELTTHANTAELEASA